MLITITLLAFLVLLLVSLASLTRVETQVAGTSQQLAQARQNALMALNIAIGQLQTTVGPDQRTTFRADMMDPGNVNGVPFNALPKPGLTRWIAAVGNGNIANYGDKPSAIPVYATTGSVNKPILLNWLVSGNETASFTPQTDGHISSPATSSAASSALTYLPTNTVRFASGGASSLTDTALTALSTNVTVNGQAAQLLVGPNSASSANAAYSVVDTTGATSAAAGTSTTPATGGSDYVFAPKVNITAPAGSFPAVTTAPTIGRYAYWVGDENIKARANLMDNYLQQTTATAQQANTVYSAFVAQHNGIGFMDSKGGGIANSIIDITGVPSSAVSDTKNYIIGTDFNYNNYDSNNVSLSASYQDSNLSGGPGNHIYTTDGAKLVAFYQIPFIGVVNSLHPTYTSTTINNLQTALKNRFHDISITSCSVLSDSYAGGLKKDLSAALSPNWTPPASHDTADTKPLFTPETTSDYDSGNPAQWSAVPNWGQVRDYFKQRDNGAAVPNGIVTISKPTATRMGVYPSLVYGSMGFSVYADSATGQLYMAIYPFIALNNPYNAILQTAAGKGNDQVGFRFRNPVGDLTMSVNVGGAPIGTIDLVSLQGGPLQYFRFKLATNSSANTDHTTNVSTPNQFRAGYVAKFSPPSTPPNNYTTYDSSGNNPLSYSADTDPGISDQSHCVTIPLSGLILTAAQVATASNNTLPTNFSLVYTGTKQGELDVIYASSTGSGTPSPAIGLTPPPNSATNPDPDVWWDAIQHCVFTPPTGANATLKQAPLAMGQPDTVPSLIVGTAITLSSSNNLGYDSSIALRPFAQSNGFRSRLKSRSALDTWSNGTTLNPGNNIFSCYMQKNTTAVIPPIGETDLVKMQSAGGQYQRTFASYFFVGFDTIAPDILFDIPRDDIPLLSLGQLQNANLALYSSYPAWALGNSLADVRIPGISSFIANALEKPGQNSGLFTASMSAGSSALFNDSYYDISWQINRSLFDQYFVSGIPAQGTPTPSLTWSSSDITTTKPLPNARYIYYKTSTANPNVTDLVGASGNGSDNPAYDRAAANLMLAGGFNINSTSEQAWRATLAGTYNVPYRVFSGDTTTPVQDIQVHRTVSLGKWYQNWTVFHQGGGGDRFNRGPAGGDRYLSPYNAYTPDYNPVNNPVQTQALPYLVARLAQAIVKEVKTRGPFLSMGDFVNRRLVDTTASTTLAKTGLKGALQTALDTDTSTTATIPVYSPRFNTTVSRSLSPNPNAEFSGAPPSSIPTGSKWILNHMKTGATTNQSYLSSWIAGSGQTVTQADLLSTFGPGMVARSDTFTIRTYGEVVNPVTGITDGRAWCEAVVQRVPTYIDQTDANIATAGDTTPPSSTNTTNQKFGRRFQIISFKWLTPNDI